MMHRLPSITSAEKDAFERDGFHVLRGALSIEEVAHYRTGCEQLLRTPAEHPYSKLLGTTDLVPPGPENPRAVWVGFDLPLFDERFYDLAFQPNVALAVDALIGPDIDLYETGFVCKLPGFPATYRDWHQDAPYAEPQSNDRAVTVLHYLDRMDRESGATQVVPGSHKLGLLEHVLPTEKVSANALEVANKRTYDSRGVAFDFCPGDVLIFLGRLVHKAGGNETRRARFNTAYNYVRRDNLSLKEINRYIGSGVPITRNGKLYRPAYLADA
jgi:hypothetical protein